MSTREPTPFATLLLRYRAAAHLTQEQLAARAGLSSDAIAALETVWKVIQEPWKRSALTCAAGAA